MAIDPLPNYEGTCKVCKFVVAHELQGVKTGYGHCTKLGSMALKSIDDRARIEGTPIVWHECTCPYGELKE